MPLSSEVGSMAAGFRASFRLSLIFLPFIGRSVFAAEGRLFKESFTSENAGTFSQHHKQRSLQQVR